MSEGRGSPPARAARWLVPACFAGALFRPAACPAAEILSAGEPDALVVHGFASQGFMLSLENDYLAEGTTDGSFEFSELGLNFTKNLTGDLRFGVQFFAQDLGSVGNYHASIDWFYLDYAWRDWLGFRAGRLKIPYGLYNEVQDVDAARVPVLLPQSVYPIQTREVLFAQTGAELYGFARSPSLGAVDYRLFGGTIFLDSDALTPPGVPFDVVFRVPFVGGGRLLWETPLPGFRVAGSLELVRFDTTVLIPGAASLEIENRSTLWVASAEYQGHDLTITAEYSRWNADQRSNDAALSPPIDETSERMYGLFSLRLAPWIQPAVSYALFYPNVDDREGRENQQHDLGATLRFDVNSNWLVKAEGHYMVGTAGLLNPLRINPPDISTADERWAAFFLKTTAFF